MPRIWTSRQGYVYMWEDWPKYGRIHPCACGEVSRYAVTMHTDVRRDMLGTLHYCESCFLEKEPVKAMAILVGVGRD